MGTLFACVGGGIAMRSEGIGAIHLFDTLHTLVVQASSYETVSIKSTGKAFWFRRAGVAEDGFHARRRCVRTHVVCAGVVDTSAPIIAAICRVCTLHTPT